MHIYSPWRYHVSYINIYIYQYLYLYLLTLALPCAQRLMSIPMPHDFQLLPSFRLEDIVAECWPAAGHKKEQYCSVECRVVSSATHL